MRARYFVVGLFALAVLGCAGGADKSDMDTGSPGDTASGDSGDTDSGDTDSGDTGDDPCGEAGICELIVDSATVDCGSGTPGDPPALSASSPAAGQVALVLTDAEQGCCPTIEASAVASLRNNTIDAEYSLIGDECDCVCSLDVALTLSAVPTGGFTVHLGGVSASVTVE